MKWNGDQMKPKGLLRKLQMTQHQLQMTANETKLNQKLNTIKTDHKSKAKICNRIINQNQNGIGIVYLTMELSFKL